MLSAIRALARSPIVGGFIIVLLIAAFALFGVNDIFRGAGTAAVVVGGERVGVADLQRTYERQITNIQAQNPRFTREQADELGIGEQVVQFLTAQAAVEAKARELGLAVSNQQVLDAISEIEAFRNPFSGQFDQETYLTVLRNNGYSGPRAGQVFEAELRDELLRIQVLSAIVGGVQAPTVFSSSRRSFEEERRSISALLLPASLVGEIAAPSDEVLESFIAENSQIFQQPEQRQFTLVRLNPIDYIRDVDIPEQDLRDLYQFQVDTGALADPATRSLTQWIAADEAEANAGVAALQAGQNPIEAGLGDGVSLTDVQAFEIPDVAISDAAFAAQSGDVFAVEGRLGWRVVQVDAAIDPVVPTFEMQRPALLEELSGAQAEELMADALSRFEDARSQGLDFEAAGALAGVPIERFDFMTARGTTVEGIPAATLQSAPEIVTAVFAAPQGFETDPELFGTNGYFMIRVDEITEERLPAVGEIREFAESVWRTRTIDDQLQSLLDQALTRIQGGESLNEVAASLPGSVVEAAILGREETTGPFSRQVVQSAFAQDLNMAFEARASDPTTRVVAVVTDIITPPQQAFDPLQQAALSDELGNDLTIALESALFASYEVYQNQELIDLALGRIEPNTLP